MNSYLDGLRRYFEFSGRSTRSQYWLFVLCLFVLMSFGATIDVLFGFGEADGVLPVTGTVWVLHIIPYLAVTVRRFHDSDKSAWWLLTVFIPPVSVIVVIAFGCMPSTPGPNRFGAFPGARAGQIPAGYAQPSMAAAAPVQELEKLAALHQSGAIDEHEYQRMKNRLLGSFAG